MPQVRVHFQDSVVVHAGDAALGETNTLLELPAGGHVISLPGVDTRPGAMIVDDHVRGSWNDDPAGASVFDASL